MEGKLIAILLARVMMSDEELEAIAARVKGCSVEVIHRAVQAAEAAWDILDQSPLERNGECHKIAIATDGGLRESQIESRTLKIEAVGDFFYHRIQPRIRLCGQWLERAGFKPGHRVEIHQLKTGQMVLVFKELAVCPNSQQADQRTTLSHITV